MVRARNVVALLMLLLVFVGGCQITSALAYYFRPRQIQKPEFSFAKGDRVALLIEAAQASQENPVFNRALHQRVETMLREGGSHAQLIPHANIIRLRQINDDFARWTIQKIGRELDADYVLYVKLDNLVIRKTPDHPMITPSVNLRMKLIDVNQPAVHARVWPQERDGRSADCSRLGAEAADTNPDAEDSAARKLAYDTAYFVTAPFIKLDLEESPPVEP